ncbi:RING/U-box superfamily protein [Rhynchospora pubera]|uniref:RING/U-box superfamily protein n=1 Tax=Rhynchospora pubera TaxID=906938 RepID=A0AAV8GHM8_9POAL|nr:RING/U-box superfamily protein [Rhynchospora pubera]
MADVVPDGSASATSAAQRPICAICYEDLRPVVEHLQCVPACGHVFHELCLQQWMEYCPSGKGPTCPMCKQSCGTHHKPTRLYFQSTTDGGLSQPSSAAHAGVSSDAKELTERVERLEKKYLAQTEIAECLKASTKKLTEQIEESHEVVKRVKITNEELQREKQHIQQLLNAKIEEVSRKTMECNKLQEKSLALAKELAALKLSTDMNLGEEEIVKFAYLGHSNNPESAIEVLKRSLAMRNKSYKELMGQCNILGRSESRLHQKLEKAKDQIKKLKTQLLELEKINEEKENAALRDLKHSKKLKSGGKYTSPMKSCSFETIDLEDIPDFIDNELLGQKKEVMNNCAMFSNKKSTIEQLGAEQGTPPFKSNNGGKNTSEENLLEPLTRTGSNWVKGITLIEGMNNEPTSSAVPQNEVEVHKPSSTLDSLHLPIWTTVTGGINRSTAKWCKRDTNTEENGDLIAVGPDGRGGRVKVLRSTNQLQLGAKTNTPLSRCQQKIGAKSSQFQMEHFFSKK